MELNEGGAKPGEKMRAMLWWKGGRDNECLALDESKSKGGGGWFTRVDDESSSGAYSHDRSPGLIGLLKKQNLIAVSNLIFKFQIVAASAVREVRGLDDRQRRGGVNVITPDFFIPWSAVEQNKLGLCLLVSCE